MFLSARYKFVDLFPVHVDEDADVYQEVNPDVSHIHLILEKLTRRGKA